MDGFHLQRRIIAIIVFALAFAFVESSIVVYLRGLFYPHGFAFPLKEIPHSYLSIELFRELATLLMLLSVAFLAGKKYWERFGYFVIAFGVWDIFYYVFLKISIDWPPSLFDWDILFLLPVPWVGPVIAPVLVSMCMIGAGIMIAIVYSRAQRIRPGWISWTLALVGTALILFTFMKDARTIIDGGLPSPFRNELLAAGLLAYIIAIVLTWRSRK